MAACAIDPMRRGAERLHWAAISLDRQQAYMTSLWHGERGRRPAASLTANETSKAVAAAAADGRDAKTRRRIISVGSLVRNNNTKLAWPDRQHGRPMHSDAAPHRAV